MSEARTLWEEGREPGRQVVALGLALVLSVLTLDVAVGGRVGLFFDLAFVAVCVAVALLVRPGDFFTVGVLPPLLMVVGLTLLALTRPVALATTDAGALRVVLTGLGQHAASLGVGYALCLSVLAVRDRFLRGRPS